MEMLLQHTEKHSIISDSGVGESNYGWIYEPIFKDKGSRIYKELVSIHGNQ